MRNIVYMDNAATTKISSDVLEAMMPFLKEQYGNPSSLYSLGINAKEAVEKSRETIAKCINALPNEIFFTSGGSEADNWAIKSIAEEQGIKNKKHIISSKFEHHGVLHSLKSLEDRGFEVTYLDVYENGIVRPEDVESALREDTGFVTIMYANNEIGTIQPVKAIGEICKKHSIIFHTDAVQALGKIKIDVGDCNIDLMSVSAHKINGPKGVGALFRRNGIKLKSFIDGGAQEKGIRAGTENVAGIVGFGEAIKNACDNMEERNNRVRLLRDRLIDSFLKIERSVLNGDREERLPGNISMCFEGIEGEGLLLSLNIQDICASSGSACTSGSLAPSHVLLAIGRPHEIAHGSLRLTLSHENTDEDINYVVEAVPKVVNRLRDMSPLWEKIIKSESK